jgi:hypothetical protein
LEWVDAQALKTSTLKPKPALTMMENENTAAL